MNTKGNQRAVETENRIKYVFLNLLKEKDISRISVSEICKRAEIHRTTFYVHYKDVADLMEHLALSRPDISFKLVLGSQMKFHTSGNGDLREVITVFTEEMWPMPWFRSVRSGRASVWRGILASLFRYVPIGILRYTLLMEGLSAAM